MLGGLGGDTERVTRAGSSMSPVRVGSGWGGVAAQHEEPPHDTPALFSLISQVDIPRVLQPLWHPHDPAGAVPE